MKDSSLLRILTREIQDLSGDMWLLSLVSWIPIILYTTMWWIFSQGMATDIPIGVVDLDKSRISRSLIRHYDASPSLQVAHSYLSVQNGADDLRADHIYALVVLPSGLEEELITGRPPQVSAFVNSQYLLIGKIINSALLQAQGTYAVKAEAFKNMALSTPLPDAALSAAMPISSQSTPLFNIGKNYAWFLVSAILPALWQIIMVSATVLSLALVKRRYTLASWLNKDAGIRLFVKFSLLGVLFMIQGIFFLVFMYKWLGWPMHGDWTLLVAGLTMTVVASIGCGSLLFSSPGMRPEA